MGKTANKQMICEVLMEAAKEDHDIVSPRILHGCNKKYTACLPSAQK